jgi:hypothetical protein
VDLDERTGSVNKHEVAPHEAGAGGRFTPANAAEMGARGAAKRERNLRDRVSETKQELAIHAEEAARTLGAILTSDARDADKVKAAVAILDRVGVGPHASKDVNLGVGLIERWAAELNIIQDDAKSLEADTVSKLTQGLQTDALERANQKIPFMPHTDDLSS